MKLHRITVSAELETSTDGATSCAPVGTPVELDSADLDVVAMALAEYTVLARHQAHELRKRGEYGDANARLHAMMRAGLLLNRLTSLQRELAQ